MQKHLIDYIDNSTDYDVRGVRLLLEYFYANKQFKAVMGAGAPKVVSVFGSARAKPGTELYATAYTVGKMLYENGYAVVTGASGGVMEAANHGVLDGILDKLAKSGTYKTREAASRSKRFAAEKRKYSIGLKITLPFEPHPNPYVGIFATFHYFNIRKFYFASLSKGFIACDGGWGTRDELYEVLTLVQTGKSPLMPIVVLSNDYSRLKAEIEYMAEKRYISGDDLMLIDYVHTPQDAVAVIDGFYKRVDRIVYPRGGNTVKIYVKTPLSKRIKRTVEEIVADKDSPYAEVNFGTKVVKLSGKPHKTFGYLKRVVTVLNG
ncbi:MAG: hypothetical protein Kow0090_10650 [Myxococcota bacterium]